VSTNADFTNQFYTLNINDYNSPAFAWSVKRNILAAASSTEMLGQSWATPRFCKIRQTGGSTFENVVLLSGGYDTNQDSSTPAATDSKGRAVFAVNADTGQLATTNLNTFNYSGYNKMTHCILDIKSFDDDEDGYDDTIYAPSAGGHVFAFESKKKQDGTWNGVWSKRLLFKAQTSGGKNRKFFYAPAVSREIFNGTIGEFVMIGSGAREDPNETTVTNRMYAFKNTWASPWNDNAPLTDADLIISAPLWGSALTAEEKTDLEQQIKAGNGWYFNLIDPGEKIVSTPLLYGGALYFTTMVPTSQTVTEEDPCFTGAGSFKAYLYAVDYLTGGLLPGTTYDKADEPRKEIRNPVPPKLVVTKKGEFIPIQPPEDITKRKPMDRYFWQKR
jgi:type IV pilus assembly protein PilY1